MGLPSPRQRRQAARKRRWGQREPRDTGIGPIIKFEDDGPSLGPISDAVVDLAAGASVTKTLGGVVGEDPNSSPYTLIDISQSITVNGVQLRGVLAGNAKSVTYWSNTGGDGTYGNAGDTAYYKLTLDRTGAGNYTFNVPVNPPASTQAFSLTGCLRAENCSGWWDRAQVAA